MYLYFYMSNIGLKIPGIHEGNECDLINQFEGSATPLCEWFEVESVPMLLTILRAWRSTVKSGETGLISSIDSVIQKLEENG